ncbi:hypothetical protein [Streptomyces sp. WG7]|uniref:hypothetical protein n=1 Tax=Streptomyces sp. WG7 TaxID=3417650 RepID=UPI003CF0777C
MILEDYSVDPGLAEPGDLDDAGLQTAVRAAWEAFLQAEPAGAGSEREVRNHERAGRHRSG